VSKHLHSHLRNAEFHYRGPVDISTLPILLILVLILSSLLHLSLPSGCFPSIFETEILYQRRSFLFPICAVFRTFLIMLRPISLIIWQRIKFLSIYMCCINTMSVDSVGVRLMDMYGSPVEWYWQWKTEYSWGDLSQLLLSTTTSIWTALESKWGHDTTLKLGCFSLCSFLHSPALELILKKAGVEGHLRLNRISCWNVCSLTEIKNVQYYLSMYVYMPNSKRNYGYCAVAL
jgi:hypothetical protein